MTETETTQPDPSILTADEIAVLNAARAICRSYAERLRALEHSRTYEWRPFTSLFDAGKVHAGAQLAEEHLFSLLSTSHIYLHFDLSAEQLHNPDHYAPTGRTIPGDRRLVPVA
jgi:hypothetical protein